MVKTLGHSFKFSSFLSFSLYAVVQVWSSGKDRPLLGKEQALACSIQAATIHWGSSVEFQQELGKIFQSVVGGVLWSYKNACKWVSWAPGFWTDWASKHVGGCSMPHPCGHFTTCKATLLHHCKSFQILKNVSNVYNTLLPKPSIAEFLILIV